jgi:hypothetical protein
MWFLTLRLKSAYWQVALHTDDKAKTVFCAGHLLQQFAVVPSGLCYASATFEHLVERVQLALMYGVCLK